MKKKLKQLLNRILRLVQKDLYINVKCNYKWYGNEYGGFYACPETLSSSSIVYSFGIGEDISFDESIIDEFNCIVFGFDPTPKSINWIHSQKLPQGFKFLEYGIGKTSGNVKFFLPKNKNHVSGSIIPRDELSVEKSVNVPMKSFKDIISELGHNKVDIVKLDIEGAEFDVIESIIESKIIIGQILIEFHDRFITKGRLKRKNAINLLKQKDFELFAISDSLEEFSFINKDVLN